MSLAAKPFLPFVKPTLSDEDIQAVVDCLESGWIATGPRVAQFEKALQDYCEAPQAFALTSGTAALHLALLALDLKPGDEVITTPLTFIATLNTIVLGGGTPVMADIEPDTFNIDIKKVSEKITSRTRAVVPVHFGGMPVDLDPLYDLAKAHDLRIIEDAAHAIGTKYKGRKIGSFGDTQAFSFHPNKNMTTGEGGALTTSDEAMASFVKKARFHGIDRDAFNRFTKKGSQHYDVVMPGFKYNMMDLQAAIGLGQLKALDAMNAKREKIVAGYREGLANISGFTFAQPPIYEHTHSYHLMSALVPLGKRDSFIEAMKERNVGVGLHFEPVHLYTYYRETFDFQLGDCPIAEDVGQRIVSLPLFPRMTENELDTVITSIQEVMKSL